MPVAVLVTVTLAPTMAAPCGSVTNPTTRPVLVWPEATLERPTPKRTIAIRSWKLTLGESRMDTARGFTGDFMVGVMGILASWAYRLPESAGGERRKGNSPKRPHLSSADPWSPRCTNVWLGHGRLRNLTIVAEGYGKTRFIVKREFRWDGMEGTSCRGETCRPASAIHAAPQSLPFGASKRYFIGCTRP